MAAVEKEFSMNCPRCQATLSDNARFCTGCGTAIAQPDTPINYPSEAATRVASVDQSPAAPADDPLIGRALED